MDDPHACTVPASQVEGEQREAILGLTQQGRLLYVVFTSRGAGLRVVTARAVNRYEERLYWSER